MTVANYSFEIDAELMKRFDELAGPADGDGAELLRSFMAHYVETLDTDESYDTWLRKKVGKSMETARAGGLVDNEDVEAEFAARRSEALARLASR
jgi:predicted transcriptional regulator